MAYLDEDILYNNIDEKYKSSKGEAKEAYSDVLDTICKMPRADVVEVVRCKDCKRIETTEYGGYCCLKKISVAYNDFCSYGKRGDGYGI